MFSNFPGSETSLGHTRYSVLSMLHSIATNILIARCTSNWNGAGSRPTPEKVLSENLNVTIRTIIWTNWTNLVTVTDWGDANSIILGLLNVWQHDH